MKLTDKYDRYIIKRLLNLSNIRHEFIWRASPYELVPNI